MPGLKTFLRKIPFSKEIYYVLKRLRYSRFRSQNAEEVFTHHYERNFWNDKDSVSGSGSNPQNTATLVTALRPVLDQLGVASVLDLPCGDFGWMSRVDLNGIHYTGGDVVKKLVDQNRQSFAAPGREFVHLNLLQDTLPAADCVLCRDCLVHFSFADIHKALQTIRNSPARYLATTTYSTTDKNHDIVTGDWRRLNLTLPPFSLPEPLVSIVENSSEFSGDYKDKALAFWDLNQWRKED